jgi:hypothetical protein
MSGETRIVAAARKLRKAQSGTDTAWNAAWLELLKALDAHPEPKPGQPKKARVTCGK